MKKESPPYKIKLKQISRYGAYGIVLQDVHILLTQKKSGPYKKLWGLPGGGFEFGETPEETVKRELLEETALEIGRLEFLDVFTATGEYSDYGEQYAFHQVGLIYKVIDWVEQFGSKPEEEMRWIALKEVIQAELTPFARFAIFNHLSRED